MEKYRLLPHGGEQDLLDSCLIWDGERRLPQRCPFPGFVLKEPGRRKGRGQKAERIGPHCVYFDGFGHIRRIFLSRSGPAVDRRTGGVMIRAVKQISAR